MSALTVLNNADEPVVFETATAENGSLIGLITLNAPKALNALNFEMIKLLEPQLRAWQDDETIAMVLLKGAGDKAFCAGGDVVSLHHACELVCCSCAGARIMCRWPFVSSNCCCGSNEWCHTAWSKGWSMANSGCVL